MLDRFYMFVYGSPGFVRWLGGAMMSAAFSLGVLGLRLDKLAYRYVRRTGVEPPSFVDSLPGWLGWAVPESAFGWFMIVLTFVLGAYLRWEAKRLQRLMRN